MAKQMNTNDEARIRTKWANVLRGAMCTERDRQSALLPPEVAKYVVSKLIAESKINPVTKGRVERLPLKEAAKRILKPAGSWDSEPSRLGVRLSGWAREARYQAFDDTLLAEVMDTAICNAVEHLAEDLSFNPYELDEEEQNSCSSIWFYMHSKKPSVLVAPYVWVGYEPYTNAPQREIAFYLRFRWFANHV